MQNGLHAQTQRRNPKMKRFAMAIALACVLSVSAFAGEVHSVGAPSPVASPVPGDMGNGGRADGDQGNGGLADDGNQGAGGLALLILDLLF
jgi:hypothetical protein